MDSLRIIVVTYNAIPWIDKCLGSIRGLKHTVIVVDNNSSDETVKHVRSKYPDVTLIEQSENLGFGKANNIGISYALQQGAKHILLLNQDAYLVDDVLENLISFQTHHSEYGILSPIHINADKSKLDKNFSNYVNYDKNPHFFSDHILGNHIEKIYEVPFVNAAGWLISRNCLMKVGGFDPIFFHYGEDDNYCQRAKYHGFKIGILANSFLIHDREDRIKPSIKLFSKEYYDKELRKFKVKYANVNTYDSLDFKDYLRKYRKQLIKALLKNNFEKFKNLKAYLKMVKKTIPEINYSVKTNQIAQPNYLEL